MRSSLVAAAVRMPPRRWVTQAPRFSSLGSPPSLHPPILNVLLGGEAGEREWGGEGQEKWRIPMENTFHQKAE